MRKLLVAIASAVATLGLAGASHAYLVAGWDFSQFLGDGLLTIDGVNGVNSLAANYSNLDPTNGVGAESAAFGHLYFNGQFGSSNIDPLSQELEFVPTAVPLTSNLDAPVHEPGDLSFDAFEVLASEGQLYQNQLSMRASTPLSVVFRADLSSVPQTGDDWVLSFGGKTFEGSSTVTVDFAPDGAAYAEVDSVSLDATDRPYAVNLGTAVADVVFVRFNFEPVGNAWPIIDNVAISVPEPGATAQAVASLLAIAACARVARRRR